MLSASSICVAFAACASVVSSAATPQPRYTRFSTPLEGQQPATGGSTAGDNDIAYTIGNPVLTGDLRMYYIYYGSFSASQKSILEDFARGVGSSGWYNITRQYYFQETESSEKVYVNGAVTLGGTATDNYSLGKSLSGNDLPKIIQAQVDAKNLPEDTSAVYFVLTAGDVQESIRDELGPASFCSEYCGYHVSWPLKSGKRIFYSQVGNPSACMSGCAPRQNRAVSPNGDAQIDAMISVIAHELTEAVSDPVSDIDSKRAWQDKTGYENGDKCSYVYGRTSKTANGGTYNSEFNGRKFMIQQNWSPVTQSCLTFA